MDLHSIVPEAEILLALEPEEIAGVILEYLNSLPERSGKLNRSNFGGHSTVQEYPQEHQNELSKILMEGWIWLEREGLIAPQPGDKHNWIFITRRGKKVKNREGLESFKMSNIFPKKIIHPQIALKVWSAFIRGEYDTAVFQSFKEIEVAVREKGGYTTKEIGVDLMRKAFNIDNGPLTNLDADRGEKQGLSDLFSGAIGSYKNPHSHRNVDITAEEAVEMIMLASHLLKIVDSIKPIS